MSPSRRTTARGVALLMVLALVGASVAQCAGGTASLLGGGDLDDYCAAVAEAEANLDRIGSDASRQGVDGSTLERTLTEFGALRSAAPTELRDEWDTLVVAYTDLVDTLEETGVDPGAFLAGQSPDGLSPEDARSLAAVAATLQSPEVLQAAAGLEDQSSRACGIDLDV